MRLLECIAALLLLCQWAPRQPILTAVSALGQPQMKMAEKNLIKQLLQHYDKKSRPVIDADPPYGTPKIERRKEKHANSSTIPIQQVTVEFGLRLVQILDLDEMEQVLTTSMISLYEWTDYHLRWEPEDEDGIMFVHIPTKDIWLPDIALYNYADERLEERRDVAAKVHYTGLVEWHPMAIYKSACEIKIKFFPFDKQVCWLKFGPWTYDGWRVNISYYHNMTKFDLEEMIDSPEWTILSHKAKYNEEVYPCCPEPYVDITFWIWIRRSTAFYTFILILPCFLLSSLTLVLFWLPPETPAKMVLGMNIFVAFFLLMLLLEKQTPSASDSFPLIGQYYCLNMGIITLSTFLSVIVVNFHFRGDNRQEVPYWLKKLAIQHGSRLLFVNLNRKPPASGLVPSASRANSTPAGNSDRRQQRRGVGGGGDAGGSRCYEDLPMQPTGASASAITSPGYSLHAGNSSPHYAPSYHGRAAAAAAAAASPSDRRRPVNDAAGTSRSGGGGGGGGAGFQEFDDVLAQCLHRQQSRVQHQHNQHQHQQHQLLSFPSGEDLIFPGGMLDAATRRRINMLTKDVQDIVKALRYIQKLHENREKVNKVVQEWRSVALVLDRLFFLIYVLTIMLSIIFFFPKSGNEVNPGVIPANFTA
ncbi:hypothetical protein BOX15_Mlig032313g2 [Macrostomum lignano]|uniref:Neur_chan_LBD domain-containing protein n=1 Tax=Macrostomum lignano TaxID=282301 RepID=A0A267E180_9PLAT|nr:hypothetical protein BOX15_Mlig032313g2 [Macrostomum lignano]